MKSVAFLFVGLFPLLEASCCWSQPRVIVLQESLQGLFTRNNETLAFRVDGTHGQLLRSASVSLRSMREKGHDFPDGAYLIARSNGRTWNLSHSLRGDQLVADVVAGPEYAVIERPVGHLRHSYDILCRVVPYLRKPPRPELALPRICHQILCAPGVLQRDSFLKRYPEFVHSGIKLPEGPIGGWPRPHESPCEVCMNFSKWEILDLIIPDPVWWFSPRPCSEGPLLLKANFNTDCTSAPPTKDLPGPPDNDRLDIKGGPPAAYVVNNAALGSHALQLKRLSPHTRADFVLAEEAAFPHSYCVAFRGHVGAETDAATMVSIVAAPSVDDEPTHTLCRLIFDTGNCRLVTGGPSEDLPGTFGTNEVHEFHFDIDLLLRRFTLTLDGEEVTSALPFIDPDATSFNRLRFDYLPCALECFASSIVVDDVRVRRTNPCIDAPVSDSTPPVPHLIIKYTDLANAEQQIERGPGDPDVTISASKNKPINVAYEGSDPEGLRSVHLDYDMLLYNNGSTTQPLLMAIERAVACPCPSLEGTHDFNPGGARWTYTFAARAVNWLTARTTTGKVTINAQ